MLQVKLNNGQILYIRGEHIESITKDVGHPVITGKSGKIYTLSLDENIEDIVEVISKL